jgi:asparagine synthase (glutamine-hydrolysing)
MAGIAGIVSPNRNELVLQMLNKMKHRGEEWCEIVNKKETTLGMLGFKIQEKELNNLKKGGLAKDGFVPGRVAQAQATSQGFILKRDPIGAAPLYYGWTKEGDFCFASEVKSLMVATNDVHEFPTGCKSNGHTFKTYFQLEIKPMLDTPPEIIATELRKKLENSIEKCIGDGNVGAWLSGGLDSSIMAAIARRKVREIHTFAGGLPGAPDLDFARQMADYIKSTHHEVIVEPDEIKSILPEVIYYLESFDALLVRSTILNYLVGRSASHFVPAVFSGEGGDELFAGYEYLKGLKSEALPHELVDIIGRLHNTALQRVDRSASANGTIPLLGFLDPEVVDYALQIPVRYKIHQGVEKWILRQAATDLLPPQVLNRKKAKFWEGGGFLNVLSEYADEIVSNTDFEHERNLPNGWRITTKEELLYYRIFKETFGKVKDLSWMGRTKGAPVT